MACFWSKLADFGYNYRVSSARPQPSGPALSPGRASSARAQLQRFALILAVSGSVVALIGLLRLARQFPSASQSPSLLVPFLPPVAALALEAGALVALSCAQLGALVGLGERGAAQRARFTAASLVAVLAVLGVAQLVPRGTERPGAFANELIQSAMSSCGDHGEVVVPLLGLRVRCGEPRRIVGPMPGVRSVEVAMSALSFSDDLRRVEIRDLELAARRALSVHLRAGRATIVGIAPWSRSTRLGTGARLAVLALLATALWSSSALFGARAVPDGGGPSRSPSRGQRWLGLLLSGLPGVAVAAGLIVVDQDQATPWAYLVPAALGALGAALLRLLVQRLPRMFSSSGSF